MRSEFDEWYEKWTGSKVKCENYDVIGAWQHQQSKVDELQKRVDAALKMISINRGFAWGGVSIGQLEQALKGGGDE